MMLSTSTLVALEAASAASAASCAVSGRRWCWLRDNSRDGFGGQCGGNVVMEFAAVMAAALEASLSVSAAMVLTA